MRSVRVSARALLATCMVRIRRLAPRLALSLLLAAGFGWLLLRGGLPIAPPGDTLAAVARFAEDNGPRGGQGERHDGDELLHRGGVHSLQHMRTTVPRQEENISQQEGEA